MHPQNWACDLVTHELCLPFTSVLRRHHLILKGFGEFLAIYHDLDHVKILLELACLVITYYI